MSRRPRRNHTPAFKAKVARRHQGRPNQLAEQFDVQPNQITSWKGQLEGGAADVFVEGATLAALRGRKVSIGPVGSGSHALLLRLLKRNEIDQEVGELLTLAPHEAADKLLAGEIDAAAMLASWEAPVVQQLIADERAELLNLARADAYVALYPFLSKATVPRGVGDLGKDLPPADVTVFASKASLVQYLRTHPVRAALRR